MRGLIISLGLLLFTLTIYGQEDHVRLYSVEGLKERLESAGFQVKTLTYSEEKQNFYGFRPKEVVLLASK